MMSATAPLRVWEHQFSAYRQALVSNMLASIVRPLLYLLGMGVGLGSLIERPEIFEELSYLQFFGPAIIATTAMMVLVNEALWPIYSGFAWDRTFYAQAATPLTVSDIVTGLGLWHFSKAVMVSAGVTIALALFDQTRSLGLIPATIVGGLTAIAYTTPLMAWSASRKSELSFPNVVRFFVVPMFLFCGAFYPISQLPNWLQYYAMATPVWHGIELCRQLTYNQIELLKALIHIGYLIIWAFVGWLLARRAFSTHLSQ